MQRLEVDVAVLGGGGAGLTLLHQLALRGPRRLRIAVVDPVDRLTSRPDDRTWCFWDRFAQDGAVGSAGVTSAGAVSAGVTSAGVTSAGVTTSGVGDDVASALTTTWGRAAVRTPGADLDLDLAPLRYALLRAADFYALVADVVASSSIEHVHVPERVRAVRDGGEGPALVVADGTEVSATWVFDSRPSPPARAARTCLVQHFAGRYLHFDEPVLDADRPVLMDLRTPQPSSGVSFGYVLPLAPDRALVEYTEFTPAGPAPSALVEADERGLDDYLALTGLDGSSVIEHTESGAIPMADARHDRRAGARLFRIGIAAGATRPSTGYTFAAMHRMGRGVAELLRAGRDPVPPAPYPRRHALMDALLLRALASGDLSGPEVFGRLFARNPTPRVLDLLDGRTSPRDELALMATVPPLPMLRALAWTAARRRR